MRRVRNNFKRTGRAVDVVVWFNTGVKYDVIGKLAVLKPTHSADLKLDHAEAVNI